MKVLSHKNGWIIAAPIMAAAIFYVWKFADLFLLIEYRQWVEMVGNLTIGLRVFFDSAILHSDWAGSAFPRTTSIAGLSLFSTLFGGHAEYHNLTHIGMVLAAGAFMGALLARQTRGRYTGLIAAAVLLFLFSIPALDAITWQATLFDKFSALLMAAFTWHVGRTRVPVGLLWHIADQVILLLLTILTVNAKEAAWPIVPTLVLLAAVQRAETESILSSIGKACVRFGLSIVYSAIHIGIVMYNRYHFQTAEAARTMSGSPASNLRVYEGYLSNHLPYDSYGLVLAIFAAVIVFVLWIVPIRRDRLFLLWAALSFGAVFAIPMRTTAQSPFYLLVPAFYLAILLFWIATAIADVLIWRSARIVGAVVVGVALVAYLAGFARETPSYFERAELSRHFQQSLKAVAAEAARDPSAAVTFYYPASLPTAYMFVGADGPDGHALARYFAPAGATASDFGEMEKRIHDAPRPDDGPQSRVPNEISVYLADDLSIAEIEK